MANNLESFQKIPQFPIPITIGTKI